MKVNAKFDESIGYVNVNNGNNSYLLNQFTFDKWFEFFFFRFGHAVDSLCGSKQL